MKKYTVNYNTFLPISADELFDKAMARSARVSIYGMPNPEDNGEYRLDDDWQLEKKDE